MEFTQEAIDALAVNEVDIMKKIADELNIRVPQVSAVISLVNEGCTIPFISRYRKEKHGALDEVQVRDTDHLFKSYTNSDALVDTLVAAAQQYQAVQLRQFHCPLLGQRLPLR